jgi:uncharacterized protein YbaR (Trm112 family)
MHILLTDILTCPRCGPAFGLILLADSVTERRVREGTLGCANCREKYPIHDGVGLFDSAGAAPPPPPPPPAAEEAVRLAALMGLTEGAGHVLLAGDAAAGAAAVAGLVAGVEVVAVSAAAVPAAPGVSRLRAGARLPLASACVAGAALTGAAVEAWLEEAARVLSATGRLVLDPAPTAVAERLAAAGLGVVLQEGSTVIAARRR